MKVEVEINPSADLIQTAVNQWGTKILEAIAAEQTNQTKLCAGHIDKDHLRGKGPFPPSEHRLGVIEARLRQSVTVTPAEVAGEAVISSLGTNVEYAAVHEYGFQGTVQVAAHVRKRSSKQSFLGPVLPSGKRGRSVRKTVRGADIEVKGFTRKMDVPERAPFRTGADEYLPEMTKALTEAIKYAVKIVP